MNNTHITVTRLFKQSPVLTYQALGKLFYYQHRKLKTPGGTSDFSGDTQYRALWGSNLVLVPSLDLGIMFPISKSLEPGRGWTFMSQDAVWIIPFSAQL